MDVKRRPPRALLGLLGTSSCVATTDIVGTPEQVAIVEDTLATLATEVRPERWPSIRAVRFEPVEEDEGGHYEPEHAVVVLDETLPPDWLALALRHETCHAMDLQSPRPSFRRAWPVFDAVPASEDTDRLRRIELFAYLCELGPEGLARLGRVAGACLPEGVAEVVDEIVEEWFEPDAVPVHGLQPSEDLVAAWDGPEAPSVGAWMDESHLAGRLPGEVRPTHALDVVDGTWGPAVSDAHLRDRAVLVARAQGVNVPLWVDDAYRVGGEEAWVSWTLLPWGGAVSVVASSLDDLAFASGCLPGRAELRVRTRALAIVEDGTRTSWLRLRGLEQK